MKRQVLKRIRPMLRKQQSALRDSYKSNYRRFCLALCSHYLHYDFVRELQSLIEINAWDKVLEKADSLASQKYDDATLHFVANQFALIFRKYPFDPRIVKTDPEKAAIKTFLSSERKCARMNKVFKLFNFRSPYENKLSRMRNFIRYVIGQSPDISKVYNLCAYGGGASVGVHGNATNVGRKISATEWTVSPGAFVHGFNAVMDHAQLREHFFEKRGFIYCHDSSEAFQKFLKRTSCISYNKISFVPKTAKTHRTIAVEPLVNGYLQKGVDNVLRLCLSRVNIHLDDQTRNQRFAREGSINDSEDSFVTIDLRSASDSVSIGLIKNLLPEDWFYLLDSLRSKSYMLNGKVQPYHKFCSMGNGFCFPLESLVFAAACVACDCGVPGTDFTVYGDDIIVRKRHCADLIFLLKKIGFSVNTSKTFLEGPFRESCGEDWFLGRNVRPFTLDFRLDSIEAIFKILNITKERSSTELFFKPVRPFLFGLIDSQLQLVRPFKGNHDSGIDGYDDEYLASPNCYLDKREQIWKWRELDHRPVLDESPICGGVDDESIWMYALLGGATSNRSKRHPVAFYLRRKTRTTVVLTGHGGASSIWLPAIARP